MCQKKISFYNFFQTFPLSTVSINCTLHSIQCLKSSRLNAIFARFGSAFVVANLLQIGQLIFYAKRWIEENKSITEAGFLLVDVKKLAMKKPAKLIEIAQQATEEQTKRNLFQIRQENDEIVARFDSI